MYDYFQHKFSSAQTDIKDYSLWTGVHCQNCSIDFASEKNQAFSLRSQNNLHIDAKNFFVDANMIDIESAIGDVLLRQSGPLQLNASQISCKQQQASIKIDNNGIKLSAQLIVISANKVQDSCAIACVGDQHVCPQQDGPGNPHMGGEIRSGSDNVFINGKSVARHGDFAPCKIAPNQIVSHLNGITVNGKAVAHQLANTQHQGKIVNGSKTVTLAPAHITNKAAAGIKVEELNELHLEVRYIGMPSQENKLSTRAYVHFEGAVGSCSAQGVISNLTQASLTGLIQLTII